MMTDPEMRRRVEQLNTQIREAERQVRWVQRLRVFLLISAVTSMAAGAAMGSWFVSGMSFGVVWLHRDLLGWR